MKPDAAVPVALPAEVARALRAPLIDHHCGQLRRRNLERAEFESLITASSTAAPPGATHFDTALGMAIRRWCAPLLDLAEHVPPAVYLGRRGELGAEVVNTRLLRAADIVAFLVDTGSASDQLITPREMAQLGAAATDEIVCLEQVEADLAVKGPPAAEYSGLLADELSARAERAVGLSSISGYACGPDFDPQAPRHGEIIAAASQRLAQPEEPLTDPVLLRHLLWTGVEVAKERSLPIQVAAGYGGAAGDLYHGDPTPMSGFLRAVQPHGLPIILLHRYPHHRQAAYLAAVYPHVYVDVGSAVGHTAAGSAAVISELLDFAPLHKQLFSSGCYGLAELCYLGALFFRRGLALALAARLTAGEWCPTDAARAARMIGSANARRVYRL